MTQERLGWWQQAWLGLGRPGQYYRLALLGRWRVTAFFALLIILLSVTASLRPVSQMLRGVGLLTKTFAAKSPEFTLRNGELTVDADMPLVFQEADHAVFIVDTTEAADPTVLDNYEQGVLLTRYAMYEKKPYALREIQYAQFGGFSCDKAAALRWLPYLRALAVIIPCWQLATFTARFLLWGLLLAAAGWLLSSLLHRALAFAALVRIALYAQLLPSLLVLAFDADLIDFRFSWWVKMVLFALAAVITTGLAVARFAAPAGAPAGGAAESAAA